VKDDDALARALDERRRSGAARGVLTFLRKGGETFEGEFTSAEVATPDGEDRTWIVVHDLVDRRHAEQTASALRESNEMLRALTDAAFEAVVIHRDGVILVANRAAEEAARVPPGGLVGKRLFDFIAPEALPMVLEKIRQNSEEPYDSFGRRSDGSTYPLEVQVRVGPVSVNGVPARVAALRDLTERKKLEEELRHAQKMEAVGRLAGGVAHDFNNLLSVILGSLELATLELDAESPALSSLADIRTAAERAAELTRQLLAFGRKQQAAARPIDLNGMLLGMESMLRSLVGSTIRLFFTFGSPIGTVVADPSQLELMLLNLAANARDAMPKGGTLHLATSRVGVDRVLSERLGIDAGRAVSLRVIDDGIGMDEATKRSIFEPFFTTKEAGRGTGLGLSTVFGIVKQNRGSISVESAPGRGTTFTVLLPESAESAAADSIRPAGTTESAGSHVLLVVDDEPAVRRIVVQLLRRAGYEVFDADGPEAALSLLEGRGASIDLLITDMLLAGRSGRSLAAEVQQRWPALAVLFMSGYPQGADLGESLKPEEHFLHKPFTANAMITAVEQALASRTAAK
jgi:PAS domain S-box-containing protein